VLNSQAGGSRHRCILLQRGHLIALNCANRRASKQISTTIKGSPHTRSTVTRLPCGVLWAAIPMNASSTLPPNWRNPKVPSMRSLLRRQRLPRHKTGSAQRCTRTRAKMATDNVSTVPAAPTPGKTGSTPGHFLHNQWGASYRKPNIATQQLDTTSDDAVGACLNLGHGRRPSGRTRVREVRVFCVVGCAARMRRGSIVAPVWSSAHQQARMSMWCG
jgi:hypothetical protein